MHGQLVGGGQEYSNSPAASRAMNNLSPLIPIVAAFVAAILAFLFGRQAELSKHYSSLRTEAYVDFLGQ